MKKLLLLIQIILLGNVILPAQGHEYSVSFYSKSLRQERNVNIYLPAGYDQNSEERYPVVYFLHGAGGNNDSYGYSGNILDSLIMNQKILPVIFVKPDGSCPPYEGSMYVNSPLYGNFEDYIYKDLVGYVDSAFRTLAFSYFRSLAGHSMGGYGAVYLSMKHPGLFNSFESLSGFPDVGMFSLWIPQIIQEAGGKPPYIFTPAGNKPFTELMFMIAGGFSPDLQNLPYKVDLPFDSYGNPKPDVLERWNLFNPVFIVRGLCFIRYPQMYFDCGKQDQFRFFDFNKSFADTLAKDRIPYHFEAYNGDHSGSIYRRIAGGLEFSDSLFRSCGELIDPVTHDVRNLYISEVYSVTDVSSIKMTFFCRDTCFSNLEIFNLEGDRITAPVDGETIMPGYSEVSVSKIAIGTGIFYCRYESGGKWFVRKFVILDFS